MAKTENNQGCGSTENALMKSSQGSENLNSSSEIVPATGKCAFRTSCSHLKTAVNFNRICKTVQQKREHSFSRCVNCEPNILEGDEEKTKNFMLCMKCGECCCADHAVRHYQTARSDPHLVYIDTDDWNVKCFECDCSISSESSGQLNQSISFLKNRKKSVVNNPESETPLTSSVTESSPSATFVHRPNDTHSSLAVMIATKPTSSLPPPRGLTNLGNTCFFNSVLQCLARTPFLVETLHEMREPGERVVLKLEPHSPIEVELREKWGSVTETLVSTLIQITTSTGSVFTPAHLLEALRSKHRQFMGYNQHDAHELLRTLLDCVKNEDLRRYRMELLRHLGLSQKTNPEHVDEKKKALAKEMDKKLTEIVNVRPDPVFRGFTVSANTCIKCSHKSEIPESFLDLSLPVCFFKLQPLSVNRRKNDFVSDKPSKHQLKKERAQALKNKKLVKRNKRLAAAEAQKHRNSEKRPIEIKDVSESGYSSGKAPSPVQDTCDNLTQNDSHNEILAEALNEINSSPVKNLNDDNGSANSYSSEAPCTDVDSVDISSVDVANNVNLDEQSNNNDGASTSSHSTNIEQVDGESASSFRATATLTAAVSPPPDSSSSCRAINSLNNNLPKLSNSVDNGSSSSGGEDDDDDIGAENEGENNDADDSDERDDCVDENVLVAQSLGMTLQPPTSDDEENSIFACLREYTKCELLTGNNKVVCEKCTKEANKNSSEKKQIYRNFTKQLLIKSPPPVLILHLKRFEARGAFSFRKVDTNISFPLTLDVGPFCSATCEKLLYPNQKNILYSLYGIVEHSGSLNAGHYVAYVKVRNTTKHSYRRQFLPKNVHEHPESLSDKDLEQMMNDLQQEERQWYHISDSMFRPISEEDVLRKQAYLLFYERIW